MRLIAANPDRACCPMVAQASSPASLPGVPPGIGGETPLELAAGTAALRRSDLGNTPDRRLGFTLIELMVVITLIGIMTAIILPEMKGTFEDARLRAASRELVNVFGAAYSRAVSVNQVLRVRLDRKTGHYVIEKRVREGRGESHFIPAPEVPGGEGKLDTHISIEIRQPGEDQTEAASEGAPPITESNSRTPELEETVGFYPDGTADPREIVLQDGDGFRLALRVNPVTARVHIVELARQ